MKVTLYANVSANGKVLLSEDPNHHAPQEVIGAAIQDIIQAGNLVMGRKSFDVFEQAFGGMSKIQAAFPGVDFVLLSTSKQAREGYKVVSSPEEAVKYLTEKGVNEIIIGGGTESYNAFLDKDLITDVCLNIVPILTGSDSVLGSSPELHTNFKLTAHRLLTNDVIQLRLTRVNI